MSRQVKDSLISRRTDIALWRDPSAKFTPWIIALMVYLATLAFFVAYSLTASLDSWREGQENQLTIEIPLPWTQEPSTVPQQNEAQIHKVIQFLGQMPNLKTFRIMNPEELTGLLEPWFGKEIPINKLPFTTLIEIELKEYNPESVAMLQRSLQQIQNDIVVEDHQVWKKSLIQLAWAIWWICFSIVAFIFVAILVTIIFTTQTSVVIHKQIIELLHIMGAKNSYIARQFQKHTFKLGMRGGFVGAIFTSLTYIVIKNFSDQIDSTLVPQAFDAMEAWGIIILIPISITLFMSLTAKYTVLRLLKKFHKF